MRVLVSLSGADRELLSDLEKIDPRNRAARLRTLATVGLLGRENGDAPSKLKEPEPQPTEEIAPHDDSDKRRELKTRLVGSLT